MDNKDIENKTPLKNSPTADAASLNDLNTFRARFEANILKATLQTLALRRCMRVLNAHKAARPDRFPRLESQVLSLDQATVSTCLKNTAIIPVPETIFNHVSE